MNILPTPFEQSITPGIRATFEKTDNLGDLWAEVIKQYKLQPNECLDGGDDKFFFAFTFKDVKLFAVANEINGLTIMLPGEY